MCIAPSILVDREMLQGLRKWDNAGYICLVFGWSLTAPPGAPLSPEADDEAQYARVVGWTHGTDFCHIPVTLAGTSDMALVYTGSNEMLLKSNVVPAGMQLEHTVAKLRTVTGERRGSDLTWGWTVNGL